ncbi:transglutaminase-like cysteine peptidase [Methylobacterium sp. WL18]|uniref:transglutaminase-like cysteine peptidase n=1 Tax=unclassified Methylobacterium TaxID=2615210 RepID=UPI0011C7F1F6|nr:MULTISPECIES: transglutaminase-like cysteine peptidase [unclassified Methylobacterium]TXN42253.1 transglutaminase-like cysteine peptidase [Methylobacterium sp. WL7]TXN64600.1 transglutaminase-like cysteine peptidase [Methylobacterium sp. WL18]
MRHADGGIPALAFLAPHWRGWSAPLRRARQAASLALVGTILMLGGANTRAHARLTLPDGAPAPEASGPVGAIAGWTEFCRRMPEECTLDVAQPAAIPLTVAVWRTLRSVNRRVNARIRPITDQAHWGVVDRWEFPDDGFGDCEDYQLLKRRMLAERGLSRRALLMTVVIDETNAGHAVLTVRTDHGDFILDNKTDAIRPWRRTGYSFIKRAGQDGQAWVSLEGKEGAAQVATAEP